MSTREYIINRILEWDSVQTKCNRVLIETQDAIVEAQKPGQIAWGQHIDPPDHRESQTGIYGTSSAVQSLTYFVSEGQLSSQRINYIQQGQAWLVDQWIRDGSKIEAEKDDKEILYKHVFCLNALVPRVKTLSEISDIENSFNLDSSNIESDINNYTDIEIHAKEIADELWKKRIQWNDVNRPAWGEFHRNSSEHDEAKLFPTALALYTLTRSEDHVAQEDFTNALRTLANRVNRKTPSQNSNPSTNIEKKVVELAYTVLALCNYRDVRGDDTEQDIDDRIRETVKNFKKVVSQIPETDVETYYKRFYAVPENQRPERYVLFPIYPNVALALISAGPKHVSSNYDTISIIVEKYLDEIGDNGVYNSKEIGFEATLNHYWISKLFYEFIQINTSDLHLRNIILRRVRRGVLPRITRFVSISVVVGFFLVLGEYLRSLENTSVVMGAFGYLCYALAVGFLSELRIWSFLTVIFSAFWSWFNNLIEKLIT